ncbi:MAG TPA: hypothetical protein VN688_06425 [Gemmataceae bacterium]|nr:hypothetical protein [Gemmataceae bacterium]
MRSTQGSWWPAACLVVLAVAGMGRGDEEQAETPDLRAIVEQQQKQLEEQQRQLKELNERLNTTAAEPIGAPRRVPVAEGQQPKDKAPRSEPDKKDNRPEQLGPSVTDVTPKPSDKKKQPDQKEKAAPAQQSIEQYLKDNPGAGMPPGVQTGFEAGRGFFIRSPPNPPYVKWQDDAARIPFEMRLRGRIQTDYYFYKVTDNYNHLTGRSYEPAAGDFSQLEVKRLRLFWEGTAFTPDLYYQFQIDGNTRGLGAFQGNRIIQNAGVPPAASYGAPGIGTAASVIGSNTVDSHGLRLFTAFVGYDIHLGGSGKGCGIDCPEGTHRYSPTLSFIVGKQQPFFGLTEILGSANAQFVDFSMADWFFDSDDNNMLMAVTAQLRAFDDRLFAQCQITNGNESQFPNVQMDRLPGFIAGYWYDFGGSWNEQAKRWNLFGNSISDLEYSVKPVVRVGGSVDLVPMDRRSIYGDLEQSRVLVTPGGPGGTRLINLLNGDATTPAGSHAVDRFNYYAFDSFIAMHFRGLSIYNESWCRILNDFQTTPPGGNAIIYQDGSGANALFPHGPLVDCGTSVQVGYFLIPRKLEIAGRWDMITGESGSINGNGRFTTTRVAGASTPVRVIDGAFRRFQGVQEWAVAANYYFYGQLLKWSTDVNWYRGGNPAGGGASPTGFIPGVDGWMVRTQLQMAF